MQHIPHSKWRTPRYDAVLPVSIRRIAWARAVRWVGWGFGEALIPIFILTFSSTFAEAGLFRSVYEIVSLVSLPFIGVLIDRKSAKYLILVSLLLYTTVGVSYFFAGFFGLAIFIVVARALNGFIWELENIGVETYYRRMTVRSRIATAFGYLDTWSTLAWIIAALVGMLLSYFVSIHHLLFLITPFALASFFVAVRAPRDTVRKHTNTKKPALLASYRTAFTEWKTWNVHLWFLSVLVFFSGVVSTLMWFFVPMEAYIDGANLPLVMLIAIIGATPSLFGYQLGKLADAQSKHLLVCAGFIGIALLIALLALFPHYSIKLAVSFILGIILELFYVIQSSLITTLGPSETYGRRGSAFESISVLGNLTAPLLLGIGLDLFGFSGTAIVVAGVAVILGIGYLFLKSRS